MARPGSNFPQRKDLLDKNRDKFERQRKDDISALRPGLPGDPVGSAGIILGTIIAPIGEEQAADEDIDLAEITLPAGQYKFSWGVLLTHDISDPYEFNLYQDTDGGEGWWYNGAPHQFEDFLIGTATGEPFQQAHYQDEKLVIVLADMTFRLTGRDDDNPITVLDAWLSAIALGGRSS